MTQIVHIDQGIFIGKAMPLSPLCLCGSPYFARSVNIHSTGRMSVNTVPLPTSDCTMIRPR